MTAARNITGHTAWRLSRDGSADGRVLTVIIPLRTPNPLNGSHQHWAAKARRRKQQRQTTGLVLTGWLRAEGFTMPHCSRQDAPGTRFEGGPRVRVVLTRLAPSSGLDDDGLTAALKSVRDGVADALGVDDRDPRVAWSYDQRRSKPRVWAVEIRIEKGGVT